MNHPLNRVASRLSALYKEHQRAWLFLFCVVLAASFWTFNSLNKSYVYTVYCPLGPGAGNDTLAITLEGKGFDLFSLLSDDSLPVVPLTPSTYFTSSAADTIPGEVPTVNLIDKQRLEKHEIKLVSVVPATIRPEEKVISARRVPVKLVLNESLRKYPELNIGTIVVRPDSVTIYGPYSQIAGITEIKTVETNAPAVPGITFTGVMLQNPSPTNLRLSTPYTWMYCKVEELTEGSFTFQLKNASGNGQFRLTTVPSQVKVVYHATASSIRTIRESDFRFSLKLSDGQSGSRAVVVIDETPPAARHVKVIPEYVECYRVEQL